MSFILRRRRTRRKIRTLNQQQQLARRRKRQKRKKKRKRKWQLMKMRQMMTCQEHQSLRILMLICQRGEMASMIIRSIIMV